MRCAGSESLSHKGEDLTMGIPTEEQETVIQFNRNDPHATIYTSDSTMMTKLDRMCESAPENYKLDREETMDGKVVGKFYTLADKTRVSFRSKKVERNLSDEERQKLSERAKFNFKKNDVSLNTTIDTDFQK